MKKKFLSALILSTAFLTIQTASNAQTPWQASGEVTLDNDVTIQSDNDFPQQTGDITIKGNYHGVNGNNHRGYGENDHELDEEHDLTIENVGKYTVDDSGNGETIIILDSDGNKTTKHLNVTNDGFHNFKFDGTNPSAIDSSIFSSGSNKTTVKNSVFKNNTITESEYEDFGRQGGAFQWNAFAVDYDIDEDDNWTIKDEDKHKDEKFEMSDSVILQNSITTQKAGEDTTVMGGGIYFGGNNENVGSTVNIINSYIIGNYIKAQNCIMAEGGGIAFDGIYTSLIKDTYFGKNYIEAKDGYGGALYYSTNWAYGYGADTNTISNSVFESNYVKGTHGAYGGAISSYNFLNVQNSLFLNNHVEGPNFAKGGAIYAQSDASNEWEQIVFEIADSTFENNSVKLTGSANQEYSDSQRDKTSGGGAIYNESGSMLIVKDSTFKNNKVTGENASGGAIFNAKDATLELRAENKDIIFENNTAGTDDNTQKSNGIADNGGIIYLNAKEGRTIQLNDNITSYNDNTDGNIYINKYYDVESDWNSRFEDDEEEYESDEYSQPKDAKSAEKYDGIVLLNADMTGYKGTVNLEGGTLAVGSGVPISETGEVNLFTGAKEFNVNNESNLDISADNRIATYNFGNLKLNANLKTTINADLENNKMDNFKADSVSGDSKIVVDAFNLLSDSVNDDVVEINLSDNTLNNYIGLSENAHEALSKIYRYDVDYQDNSGAFTFQRAGLINDGKGGTTTTWRSFNPTVLASSVAVQAGAIAAMNNTFYYSMQNADNYMKFSKAQRMALKSVNKYAATSASNGIFSPLYTKQSMNGFWFKPFSTFENIPLKDGPKVSNISYGTLLGYDTEIQELKNGGERTFTGYVGYNGASQRFKGVDSYLNGFMIGATLSHYKGNFFNATTVNFGDMIGDSSNMYGREDFNLLMAGLANKTGYNFEINSGKVIIQPSMLIGYTFVNTFDYTNSAGIRIKSDPTNVLQLSPGLRFIYNTDGGWQPYIGVNMIWNLINNSKVTANNVVLPEMTIKPYVQYGLGIQRQIENNFMMFGQAMMQNGGRNGVALTAGLRWAIGLD